MDTSQDQSPEPTGGVAPGALLTPALLRVLRQEIRVWLDEGDLQKAQAALDRVIAAHPNDQTARVQRALVAVRAQEWHEALRLWTEIKDAFPAVERRALNNIGVARHNISLACIDDATHAAASPYPAPPPAASEAASQESEKHLMLGFESLGDNCEFGLVQRHYGAEPLGLFRWAGISPVHLSQGLNHRFAQYGTSPTTEMIEGSDNDYWIQDVALGYEMHTFIGIDDQGRDGFLRKQSRRMTFLAGKLLEDIADASKTFVYKRRNGIISESEITQIFAALRSIGPATLLCVRLADETHAAGDIYAPVDGLQIGYIGKLSLYGTDGEIDFAAWLALCRRSADIRSGKAPAAHGNGAYSAADGHPLPMAVELTVSGKWQEAEAMLAGMSGAWQIHNEVLRLHAQHATETASCQSAADMWHMLRLRTNNAPDAYIGEARALMELERATEAEALLQEGIETFPRDPRCLLEMCNLVQRKGDPAVEAQYWSKLRNAFPNTYQGYVHGAGALASLGYHHAAERIVAAATRRFADRPAVLAMCARLAEQGDARAESAYANPQDYLVRADTLEAAGAFAHADALLADAEAKFPANASLFFRRSDLIQSRIDPARAVQRWTEAAQLFPNHPKAHIMRARALEAAGQGMAAGFILDAAMRQFPGHMGVAMQHAFNAKHRSDWPAAVKRFRRAAALFPQNHVAAQQLKICLRKMP